MTLEELRDDVWLRLTEDMAVGSVILDKERLLAIMGRAMAEEREACAQEADPKGIRHLLPADEKTRDRQTLINEVLRRVAGAIRARGV